MRQREDKRTGDMLQSPRARAQAAYAQRMRERGLRQHSFWLTDEEAEDIRAWLEKSREEPPCES